MPEHEPGHHRKIRSTRGAKTPVARKTATKASSAKTPRKSTRKPPAPKEPKPPPPMPTQKRTLASMNKFLAHFGAHGIVTTACEAAGIDRKTYYDWEKKYSGFVELRDAAIEEAKDAVMAEIARRGQEGYEEPVIHKGVMTGHWVKDGQIVTENTPGAVLVPVTIRKFSDTLLLARAKALMPELFREVRDVRHSGPGGKGPVAVNVVDENREMAKRISENPKAQAAAMALVEAMMDEGSED